MFISNFTRISEQVCEMFVSLLKLFFLADFSLVFLCSFPLLSAMLFEVACIRFPYRNKIDFFFLNHTYSGMSPRGVVTNLLDYDILVSKFEIYSYD